MHGEPQGAEFDAAVADTVARDQNVLAAWVFGSPARGVERPSSDLDVALLLAPGVEREVLSRLSGALSRDLGIEVDLVDLAKSTPVLGFEVVTGGHRVFARDALAADEAEERCLRAYLDTEHMRRVQRHYLYGDPL
jgi:predicted nucleotidyltransferase